MDQKPRRSSDTMQKNLECFESWNMTDAEMYSIQKPNFSAAAAPRHIKVLNCFWIICLKFLFFLIYF
jgi:hypothetical protein